MFPSSKNDMVWLDIYLLCDMLFPFSLKVYVHVDACVNNNTIRNIPTITINAIALFNYFKQQHT